MNYNPQAIFVSQHGKEIHSESGCGVASLLMLLKFIDFTPMPSWNALCQALKLDVPPVEKGYDSNCPDIGLYPEDIFRYIIKHNLFFRMHFYDDEWQACLKNGPIMVLLDGILSEYPEDAHWVVLISLDQNVFTYLDPWSVHEEQNTQKISFIDFKKCFTGMSCQLLSQQQPAKDKSKL
ncbi:MAG: papain-like cysteine protease family protein [Candidatus Berkiella sp.]